MIDNSQGSLEWDEGAHWQQPHVVQWSQLLLDSYRHWLAKELIDRTGTFLEQAVRLSKSSMVVVSHGLEDDPILNYGNCAALALWEMDWEQLVQTPSRLTAEPINRAERADMLRRAESHGYIDDYRGVRISKTGKRFLVEEAIVWNVVDAQGIKHGQAATFSQWSYLNVARHS
ncbi:MAG: MEKHLA domain-containing protein [Nitrospirales bacterium]|nr:MAG: MEKHLA domain-containing protein [Nitrospirales bacterium]